MHVRKIAAFVCALYASGILAGEFTNHIGMRMIDIPAGDFLMGSCKPVASAGGKFVTRGERIPPAVTCHRPEAESANNEAPQHPVSIKAFQMSRTEVTFGQFKKFIAATNDTELMTAMKLNLHDDETPVVQVSWHDAQAFIRWLNQSKPVGDRSTYRLPSEAEWEYACRAGGNFAYCGGDAVGTVAWYDENGAKRPHPVAGKPGNAFGLYDMSGNVWEWVEDCWHETYRGAPNDGSAWVTACDSAGRVLRSGSWYTFASQSRASGRNYHPPGDRHYLNGFRLARTVSP